MHSGSVDLECQNWFYDLDEIIRDAIFVFFAPRSWHFENIIGSIAIYPNVFSIVSRESKCSET